ncbi:MAG: hypothetical protein JWN56_2548 [Sphingobacteriales bacterium]|nr:hypothetical protein [Sphingobacteriales bacterium]
MKSYKKLLKETESLIKDIHTTDSSSNTTKLILGAVVGVATGLILGILFAPESGRDTRNSIAESAKDLGGTISEKAKAGADQLAQLKDKAVGSFKKSSREDSSFGNAVTEDDSTIASI